MTDSLKKSDNLLSADSGYYDSGSGHFLSSRPTSGEILNPSNSIPVTIEDLEESTQGPSHSVNHDDADDTWIHNVQNFFAECRALNKKITTDDLVTKLSNAEISAAQTWLWTTKYPGGVWPAQGEAHESEDDIVNFAVWLASSHECLNTRNDHGQTLLHIATACCQPETVRNIFTHGGDLKHKDAWGNNPLHVAALKGYADSIRALNIPATHPETRHNFFKVLYKSVRRPEDVNHLNFQGQAPIHLAADAGHHEALGALCQYAKAEIDLRELKAGDSAAHLSVKSGSIECLQVCLAYKADFEVRNYAGFTALQLAAAYNRKDMVDLCLELGADRRQLENVSVDSATPEVSEDDDERTDCSPVPPDETLTMHKVNTGVAAMSID